MQRFVSSSVVRLIEGSCATSQVLHLDYDERDRVVRMVENYLPDATASADTHVTTTFDYDLVGNLLRTVDANGNPTVSAYDILDRPIRHEDAKQQVTS